MSKTIASISSEVRRRFILGRQGLWPGRRWSGKVGTERAMSYIEALQIDPVSVVAQSQDIMLWGRVVDYQPHDLTSLAYQERKFFDYGGLLMIYPMKELPYWRCKMQRRKKDQRWTDFAEANPKVIKEVKQQLRKHGPLRNRDFKGKKVTHYRAGKDTGVALYYLWLTGELMTHDRHGKERVYDFLENIAPAHLRHSIPQIESEAYFILKTIAHNGLVDGRSFRSAWQNIKEVPVDIKAAEAKLATMVGAGKIKVLLLEDTGQKIYCLVDDYPLLETLQRGETPQSWQPIQSTTQDEVTFLSPLEYVSARRRAKKLFNFDYIWEIYKPANQRKYGPYTLPLLYGDQLVARMDARLDRPNRTLIINGLWLETWFRPNEAFAAALASGLARFTNFLNAAHLDSAKLESSFLRKRVDKIFK